MAGDSTSGNSERMNRRKTVEGVVVSDAMDKTITVVVERLGKHRRYKKYVRGQTKMKAHDENGEARVGDLVRIQETRPLSKTKRWRLLEVLRRAE
jgi:small subunit ribosomal protein S17